MYSTVRALSRFCTRKWLNFAPCSIPAAVCVCDTIILVALKMCCMLWNCIFSFLLVPCVEPGHVVGYRGLRSVLLHFTVAVKAKVYVYHCWLVSCGRHSCCIFCVLYFMLFSLALVLATSGIICVCDMLVSCIGYV